MAAFAAPGGEVEIGGRRLVIRNLDRVLYPQTGTTKAHLLDYYVRVGDVMLAHLRHRLLHMHRYPEGVGGPHFWQKGCPEHRPPWVRTAPVWSADKNADIEYCVADELATLVWAVNIGSLELHTSLHRAADLHRPTTLAFDLDPGEGTGILQCCEVALRLRDLFGGLGLRSVPKTSGSKGLQVYVPLNTAVTYAETKPVARAVAELLEAERPDAVVARMAKRLRTGRVLVDWSQNTEHKSMVCAYSVRAKARPTVSTPLRWDEVEAALDAGDAGGLVFEMGAVLERVAAHGDLFAGVLTERQELRLPAAQ
ncbi:MAG: bifunctional non-ous end joining protein LigD, partial [Solirubrobacteraceae bacterium]|nr:bifunctional non-ous end joining protein LigD [Solirubrobacteraceae bacterium]